MFSTQTKQVTAYGKRSKRVVDVSVAAGAPVRGEIISIFDDLPPAPKLNGIASRMKGRENATPKRKGPAPKVVGMHKKRLSPALSPARKHGRAAQPLKETKHPSKQLFKAHVDQAEETPIQNKLANLFDSPPRAPLATFPSNTLGIPRQSPLRCKMKPRAPSSKGALVPSKPRASVVEIVVVDDDGRVVSKEQRVPRRSIEPKSAEPAALQNRKVSKSKMPVYIDIDSEAEAPEPNKKTKKCATSSVVSNESDIDDVPESSGKSTISKPPQTSTTLPSGNRSQSGAKLPKLSASKPAQQTSQPTILSTSSLERLSKTAPPASGVVKSLQRTPTFEIVIPPAPYRTNLIQPQAKAPITRPVTPPPAVVPRSRTSIIPTREAAFKLPSSPIFKARPLTPIRGTQRKGAFEPSPLSPSSTDLDLSLDFEGLSLYCDEGSGSAFVEQSIPEHLKPILEECHQEDCGPHDFSSFIETFPFDPILQSARDQAGGELSFRKVGEASYSEVFGIGDVVLKVIPLRDETRSTSSSIQGDDDIPPPSDVKDVTKEIVVTRAMGEVHHGFVKLLKTYVVKGRYPELLLNLWDDFKEEKGSESIRPGAHAR